MTARACLPMYDWPEERAAVDAFWTHLCAESGLDLPETLTRPTDEAALFALWLDPALILSQCCWGPMSLGLFPGLRVLAQPDYSDAPGGRGPFYRSVLVAREGEAVPVPEVSGAVIPEILGDARRLAVNTRHSMSGWIALREDAKGLRERAASGPRGVGEKRPPRGGAGRALPVLRTGEEEENALEIVETGGHRASIRAVAEGRADLAAIDCRAWALALRHEPCVRDLVVVGWTTERPGLPFVTGAGTDDKTAARLRETLIGMGGHPPEERDI